VKIRSVLPLAGLLATMSMPASARSLRDVCLTTSPENKFAFILEKFEDDRPDTRRIVSYFTSR
jgi:hypothetical protein